MKPSNLRIGNVFVCGEKRWRVTDIGTRVVVAIYLDPEQTEDWFHGPPFGIAEMVFDEYDLAVCELEK